MTDKPKSIPRLLIVLTVLSLVWPFFARAFQEWMSDSLLHFDFAIANFVTAFSIIVLLIAWVGWLWFRSGCSKLLSRYLPLALCLIPLVGLILYRPIFRGGMSIDRWEARWWAPRQKTKQVDSSLVNVALRSDADAFPQFLGPSRDGVVQDIGIDFARHLDAQTLWKQPIGAGWSGFVASSGVCFTIQQDGEDESIICLEIQSGKTLWDYRQKRRHDEALGGLGPRSTPTLDQDRLYCQGANGLLVCLNACNGEMIWQSDISKLLGIPLIEKTSANGLKYQIEEFGHTWGRSGSPLIVDDLVVVPGGGVDKNQVTLLAFDKRNGNLKWKGGEDAIGYSSPALLDLAGTRQIVSVNEASVTGVDPFDGRVLWRYSQPGNSQSDANASQPLRISNNRILTSKGYGMGGIMTEVHCEDGNWKTKVAWANSQVLKTKLTSSVVKDDYAYAISDGNLECVHLADGKRKWKSGRFGHGQLLLVGDHLLVHGEAGGLSIIKASPNKFEKLVTMETIDGVCWNTLCLYRNNLLLRSDVEAMCIEFPLKVTQQQ